MITVDKQSILDAVHQLPPEEQWELASEIMRTVPRREPPAAPLSQRGTAVGLRGLAKTDEPLDDAQLLDESRTERYG